MTITTTYTEMLPVLYDAPFVNASPAGLYQVMTWTDNEGPTRFLADGVQIRPWNYGGANSFGVWDQPWCGEPGSDESALKTGVRPDMNPEPFPALTVWSYDECDLTAPSRTEVRARAQHVLRLEEQTAVERAFAARLLSDAAASPSGITSRPTHAEAIGYLEGELSKTNTMGLIHAGAHLASDLGPRLVFNSSIGQRSILGHRYAFGGGYVEGLGNTLIATSPTFGWRDAVQVREAIDAQRNVFAVVAERSVVVGYEALIAAVTVTG